MTSRARPAERNGEIPPSRSWSGKEALCGGKRKGQGGRTWPG